MENEQSMLRSQQKNALLLESSSYDKGGLNTLQSKNNT